MFEVLQAKRAARITKGALTDWSILEHHNIAELLGALLEFAVSGTLEDRARWKEKRDAMIERRTHARHALPPSDAVR